MATYIMMSTLTDEGRKTLKERPERLQAVNKEVEEMGQGSLTSMQFWVGTTLLMLSKPPATKSWLESPWSLARAGQSRSRPFQPWGSKSSSR